MLVGMLTRLACIAAVSVAIFAKDTVQLLTKDGKTVEGQTSLSSITVAVNSAPRKIALSNVLSIHSGEPASAYETGRIESGFAAIQAYKNEVIQSDARRSRDAAVEELTAIGLPVLTPLLKTLKDTDQHEPRPLYRLFERVVPSEADQLDRDASLIRLASGELLRGKVEPFSMEIDGQRTEWSTVRRIAVRRKAVTRDFELHSLRHSTQIEYLDSGVVLTPTSAVSAKAKGFVRLSWDVDGWACDGNGLKVPGPKYTTHLVDGHPFGAIVGRVGSKGEVILIGASFSRKGMSPGRFHLAVNDNRHWQNNVGSFRVSLQVADGYDVGAPQ